MDLVVGTIRGGALCAPNRMLDMLLEPAKTLGLTNHNEIRHGMNVPSTGSKKITVDYILYLLGF